MWLQEKTKAVAAKALRFGPLIFGNSHVAVGPNCGPALDPKYDVYLPSCNLSEQTPIGTKDEGPLRANPYLLRNS